MNDNYIVINGKRAELTPEQLKALGIEVPKGNAFERQSECDDYYYINMDGTVCVEMESGIAFDKHLYDNANYCADKELMQQRALHEILDRLLWRFSMIHNGDKIDWRERSNKYFIYFNCNDKCFSTDFNYYAKSDVVYFYTREIAEQAIKEIVEPFMAEHPDFEW